MPGHNNGNIPHSRRPISLQHVIGQTLPQCHKSHPFCLSYGCQFPTANGVGMVRGDQCVAKECYLASMKQKMVDSICMDELDMRDEVSTRPAPLEELEPIQLDDQPEHLFYIGSKLDEDVRNLLIHFLKKNMEVFAWKQEDMEGINPAVITHKLNVSPSFKPVKKKKEFHPIKAEVDQ